MEGATATWEEGWGEAGGKDDKNRGGETERGGGGDGEGGRGQSRRLVIRADEGRRGREGGKVIFLSCFLHLFAHHRRHTQTNTWKRLPCMSMNYPWNNGGSSH